MDTITTAPASQEIDTLDVTPTEVQAEQKRLYPGLDFFGWRISYIRSELATGWGSHEGDVLSRTLFDIAALYEPIRVQDGQLPPKMGYRIIVGRHSFWLVR